MEKRVLYFECKTGAAGDMLMGALYDLLSEEQKKDFLDKINSISEEITVSAENKNLRGIGGIHMCVKVRGQEEDEHFAHSHEHEHEHMRKHSHEHEHTHMHEHIHTHRHGHHAHTSCPAVLSKISELDLGDVVKGNASDVYRVIAAAEGKVHQADMENIHFHEVGSLDALIDVVGCCLAIDMLQVEEIACSPVCVGNGTVRCAHGILPVPAPATAEIIKGMPVYTSTFDGELLTPTGAAILKHFVQKYTKEMNMVVEKIGYGFGTKEFEQLSCVRVFLGKIQVKRM